MLFHLVARDAASCERISVCTPEECWQRAAKWAATKKIGGRATKLFDTKDAAEAFAASKGLAVEYRPCARVRCEDYCEARNVCPDFQAFKRGGGK